jgi:acylphosphatase
VRHIQEARKEAGFEVDDRIEVEIKGADEVLESFKKYIETETLSKIVPNLENPLLSKDIEVEEMKVKIKLKK